MPAFPRSRCPGAAILVGHDLHANLADILDYLFHEYGRIGIRLERPCPRAVESIRQLTGVRDQHRSVPVAGRGFQQQWIAETFGMAARIAERLDRALTPRYYRESQRLCHAPYRY